MSPETLWYFGLFLALIGSFASGELTMPNIEVISSSDYEQLRDEFLKTNSELLPTSSTDSNDEDSTTLSTTDEPAENLTHGLPIHTTTEASSTPDDYPDEEESSVGAEPVGLSLPTIPPQTAFESMEHVVIVGRKTTSTHDGKVISVEGVTIASWPLEEPEDTRDLVPTHPPGTFPGANPETTTENDVLADEGSLASTGTSTVTAGTAYGPLASLNAVIAAVSLLGSNLTLNSESLNGTILEEEGNGTAFNGTGEAAEEGSVFFTGGSNEDSVLILSDAVVEPSNSTVNGTDDEGEEESTGTTTSRKMAPTVLPIHPTAPGIKSIGSNFATQLSTG